MRQVAIERVMALDAVHLIVASQAMVARLRRVHEAVVVAKSNRERDFAYEAHVETCVALMNVLSVLDADGTHVSDVQTLKEGLAFALSNAKRIGLTSLAATREKSVRG